MRQRNTEKFRDFILIKEFEKGKKEILEKYVKKESSKIIVNWDSLIKLKQKGNKEDYFNILNYLKIKKILTYEGSRGSFFIKGFGKDISPCSSEGNKYNFTRRLDAKTFAQEEYKHSSNKEISIAKNLGSILLF